MAIVKRRINRPSAASSWRFWRSTSGIFSDSGRGLSKASTTATAARARVLSHSARHRINRTNNHPVRSAAAKALNIGTPYFLKMRLMRAQTVYPKANKTMAEINKTKMSVPTPMPGPMYRKSEIILENLNRKDTAD
jgi:hypothetical protein